MVIPVSGKNFAIGYFQTIDDFDDNVIFQEYDAQRYEKVRGSKTVGSPADITGVIAYIDHHDENTLDISVINIGDLPFVLFQLHQETIDRKYFFSN